MVVPVRPGRARWGGGRRSGAPSVLGALLALVAGFMVFIALDELLPASQAYGREHWAIVGVILGMAAMAISLAALT